jgi:hypothetical protein
MLTHRATAEAPAPPPVPPSAFRAAAVAPAAERQGGLTAAGCTEDNTPTWVYDYAYDKNLQIVLAQQGLRVTVWCSPSPPRARSGLA